MGTSNYRQIACYVTPQQLASLKELAVSSRVSVAVYLREAVDDLLKKYGPAQLSRLDQLRVDIEIEKARRVLDHRYEARMNEHRKEFEQAMEAMRRDRDRAIERQRSAEQLERVWRGRAQSCRSLIATILDRWRVIASALHPDRAPPDRVDKFNKASVAINQIKDAVDRTDHKDWG